MEFIRKSLKKIYQLCDEHRVDSLYVFGSALSGQFNEKSDIDLLVQFGKIELLDYFDNYMDLKEKLENLFSKPVDLVENQAIKNPIFRKIVDRDKKLIYERKGP